APIFVSAHSPTMWKLSEGGWKYGLFSKIEKCGSPNSRTLHSDNSPLLSGKLFYRPATITMADIPNGKVILTWDGKAGNEDIVVGPAQPPQEGNVPPPFG